MKTRFGNDGQYFLFDTLVAPLRWELLSAGLKLKLFDYLQVSRTAEEVASRFDLIRKSTELFLNAMVSIGFLYKHRERYQLSDSYLPLLGSESNASMCEVLDHLGKIKHVTGSQIIELLAQSNKEAQQGSTMTQPEFWTNVVDGLRSFHVAVRNPIVMDILMSLTNFPSANRILDLGAGSERLALDILSTKPDIQTVIFDLPEVASLIRSQLTDTPQIQIVEGDLNKDSLGQEYDLVWASMVLNYAQNLPAFMGKVRQSMRPGGLFASFHEKINQDRTFPEFHVVGRIHAELQAGSLSLEAGAVEKALHQANFKNICSRLLETPFGNMELVTGVA